MNMTQIKPPLQPKSKSGGFRSVKKGTLIKTMHSIIIVHLCITEVKPNHPQTRS